MGNNNIRYFIHDLEDNNVRIEATNKEDVDKVNTIEIPHGNTEMVAPLQLDVPLHQITSLILSHCQLVYLPESLFAPNLIELDLSYNRLRSIPPWILQYNSKLQIVNVSHNLISAIDSVPKFSKELRSLDISLNSFNNIPFWIFSSSCSYLEVLDLSDNPLQKYLPVLSGRCLKKLRILKMNSCKFKQDYVKLVREIPYLKVLSIGNTSRDNNLNIIQQLPFKTFYSVSTLTELNLKALGLSIFNDDICSLTSLEKLDISYNHVSWFPDNFTNLKSLKILNASHNDLISLPVDIDKLECLSELYVSHNLICSLPDGIVKLKHLKILDCYWNDLTIEAWDKIKEMSSLQAVDLEQNSLEIIDNKQYMEKREKFRLIVQCLHRENGSKYEECDSSSEYERSINFSDDSNDNDEPVINHIHEEENWDFDEDYDSDDNLVLTPFKLIIVPKKKYYDPSDYIDPVCFEDSPDDYT